MQDMHRKWQACGRWLLKINNHVGSYMNDRPFASVKLITVEPWVFCWCIYDVTDESCVNNIRNWIRYIEQHASDNVHKILVGNKADMDESKRVQAVPHPDAFGNILV
ncbi:GTP-binding protein yptV2-like isoform X4 [Daucus carota subsp. sativus]|uniref:GTP-binding protein yptV2-like isoform X4 n=1 Tax=Daucus carota subsp. sativus TaxID=79200 RepID=UPI003082C34F